MLRLIFSSLKQNLPLRQGGGRGGDRGGDDGREEPLLGGKLGANFSTIRSEKINVPEFASYCTSCSASSPPPESAKSAVVRLLSQGGASLTTDDAVLLGFDLIVKRFFENLRIFFACLFSVAASVTSPDGAGVAGEGTSGTTFSSRNLGQKVI